MRMTGKISVYDASNSSSGGNAHPLKRRHHSNAIVSVFSYLKMRAKLSGIKKAMKEVEMIESGKAKAQSLDDLLNGL